MSEEKKATDQYLEIYKLAEEMADRTSARRVSLFTFPFTAITALFAVGFSSDFGAGLYTILWIGLAISLSWWALLKSYRDLSTAKHRVIIAMEKNFDAQIFTEEEQGMKLAQLGNVERVVPLVFALLFVIVFIQALV